MFTDEELNMSDEIQDGIYFNMPENQYHALDRLSASGIKKLMISPLQFYTENYDADFIQKTSVFMDKGKAYHKMILEGQEEFDKCYVPAINSADYKDSLVSQNDLKDWCNSHDLKVSGTKSVLSERIIDFDPLMQNNIYSYIQDAYNEKHADKVHISNDDLIEINRASEILKSSDLSMHFSGGFPEVSILWTCPVTDIKCKARIDYLRHDLVSDLKTFSNSMRKTLDRCVTSAIEYERYYVQAVHYMSGMSAIKELIKAGNHVTDSTQDAFFDMIINNEQEFMFVFVETGQVNNCLARKFTKKTHGMKNNYWLNGQDVIFDAASKYKQFMISHGTKKPWTEHQESEYLDDSDFSMSMGVN